MTISKEEYLAKRHWLRHDSFDAKLSDIKRLERELDAYERENGVPDAVHSPHSTRVGTRWFYVLDPQTGSRSGKRRHIDRHCQAIANVPDSEVLVCRTPEEADRMPRCLICSA
jgi:hypothetical protein